MLTIAFIEADDVWIRASIHVHGDDAGVEMH